MLEQLFCLMCVRRYTVECKGHNLCHAAACMRPIALHSDTAVELDALSIATRLGTGRNSNVDAEYSSTPVPKHEGHSSRIQSRIFVRLGIVRRL